MWPSRKTRFPRRILRAAWLSSLLSAYAALHAQPTPTQAQPAALAWSAAQAPAIDGVLDDACWQHAARVTDFRQIRPIEGASPTERTEVQIAFDADHLYVAARCYDRDPTGIIARDLRRDSEFAGDDIFKFTLDTFNRRREGYFFAINPRSARCEGLIQNNDELRREWDAIWYAKSRIVSDGWIVEIAIPLKSLAFDPTTDTWGLNFERMIRRKQELVRWRGISRARGVSALAEFGELRGLGGLQQGRGIEFRPYAKLRNVSKTEVPGESTALTLRSGFDAVWNITPSLAATITYNTDFAEADVDEREINLSRFAITYPEKRDFFLRDAAVFSFGGLDSSESPAPYFSRRIGLSPEGLPVEIRGGAKLSGRAGPLSLGLLDVQVESSDGVPSKNLFVGRASVQVLESSSAGVIVTNGDPSGPDDNTLVGADFNYFTNDLFDGKTLIGHAWVLGTRSDAAGEDDSAFGVSADYANEPLALEASFTEVGKHFDPALGFVDRTGIREYAAEARWQWHFPSEITRDVAISVRPEYTTDFSNKVVAEDHDLPTIEIENAAGDSLELESTFSGDRLDEPYEIRPGIVIPTGYYLDHTGEISLNTSPSRPLSAELSFETGEFYTGTQREMSATLDWTPNMHWLISSTYELRQIRLPEGDFDVRLVLLRLNLAFTPDLSLNTLVQYDNLSREAGLNARLKWTVRPGSDLFLVLNEGYFYRDSHLSQYRSEAAFKAGWTWRY